MIGVRREAGAHRNSMRLLRSALPILPAQGGRGGTLSYISNDREAIVSERFFPRVYHAHALARRGTLDCEIAVCFWTLTRGQRYGVWLGGDIFTARVEEGSSLYFETVFERCRLRVTSQPHVGLRGRVNEQAGHSFLCFIHHFDIL